MVESDKYFKSYTGDGSFSRRATFFIKEEGALPLCQQGSLDEVSSTSPILQSLVQQIPSGHARYSLYTENRHDGSRAYFEETTICAKARRGDIPIAQKEYNIVLEEQSVPPQRAFVEMKGQINVAHEKLWGIAVGLM